MNEEFVFYLYIILNVAIYRLAQETRRVAYVLDLEGLSQRTYGWIALLY
jgi:hypothetical protein